MEQKQQFKEGDKVWLTIPAVVLFASYGKECTYSYVELASAYCRSMNDMSLDDKDIKVEPRDKPIGE